MGTVFFDGEGSNSVVILDLWYAQGYDTPDLEKVYSGFKNMTEALAYAKTLASEVNGASEIKEIAPNNSQGFVTTTLKNGRRVFQCLASTNVAA